MSERVFNVLFLCTGNSARSILAESILRKDGPMHFAAFSAGSQPKGEVNPLALEVLADHGYPSAGFRSKSWSEFAQASAPTMDFVFTVCASAAGETCPIWPGQPMTAHWGIDDPAAIEGNHLHKKRAFITAFRQLRNRISAFVNRPMGSLDKIGLPRRLAEIGRLDDIPAKV